MGSGKIYKTAMRKFILLFSFLILTVFHVTSQTHNLFVVNGYGSGSFNTGDSVYILGNPPKSDFIFDGWLGSAELSDTFCIGTRVKMDTADITLTPKYTAAPGWTEKLDSVNGSPFYYYFPSAKNNIRGLIIFYHGAGGNAKNWFTGVEERTFLNYAVAKGYAILATESRDRILDTVQLQPWQWSTNLTLASNPDMKNIGKIIDTLTNRGLIDYSTHIFGVGFAQGGNFLSLMANIKTYKGICLMDAPGINSTFNVSITPTYWMPSRNDVVADTARMTKCISNYNTLKARNIRTAFRVNEPFPVTRNRFMRIPGIDSATSDSIFYFLAFSGYLDASGFINFNPAADTSWYALIPSTDTLLVRRIIDQIYICYSEEHFHSDQMYRVLYFFGQNATWPIGMDTYAKGDLSLRIYPNPISDYLHFTSDHTIESMKLYDLAGKEIRTYKNPENSIDISGLSNGMYIVVFQTHNKQIISRKIIKQ